MKLYNPSDEEVTFGFRGSEYSIAPRSNSDDLDEEVARAWASTHGFLEQENKDVRSPRARKADVSGAEDVDSPEESAEKADEEKVGAAKKAAKKSAKKAARS